MALDLFSLPHAPWRRVRAGVLGLAGLGVVAVAGWMYFDDQRSFRPPGGEGGLARGTPRPDILRPARDRPDAAWEGNPADEIGLDPLTWQIEPEPEILLETGEVALPGDLAADSEKTEGRSADTGERMSGPPPALELATVSPKEVVPLEDSPPRVQEIARLLEQAEKAFAERRLTIPPGSNALAYYREVLALDGGNAQARKGIARIVDHYLVMVEGATARGEYGEAARYLDRAQRAQPDAEGIAQARQTLAAAQALATEEAERTGPAPLSRPRQPRAMAPRHVEVFRDPLKDASQGPEMVVVLPGAFTMGPVGDADAADTDEQPPQRVAFDRPFALGRYEVTVEEYLRFVEATGSHPPPWLKASGMDYQYRELGAALTGDRHPIVGISWHDAMAYATWLSKQTGRPYRLPTEAEWEYGAWAGAASRYWWGPAASHDYANYGGDECCEGVAASHDRWVYTAPVDAFVPNPFGLHNTAGNVWEWTCSAYRNAYGGQERECTVAGEQEGMRALRGGSWYSSPELLRAANRYGASPAYRNATLGFRLARDLAADESAAALRPRPQDAEAMLDGRVADRGPKE